MRAIEGVMQIEATGAAAPNGDARRVDTPRYFYPKALDPDTVLVERLRRREEGAAEALVAAYGDRVYRLAIRITGNGSDAEEVMQDALWAATRKTDTFRGTAAFGSWIYRITANAACQKRRRRWNEVAWDDVAPSFDEAGRHVEPGLDWSPRLKDPVLQTELRSVLSAAIDQLPEEFRAAFLLHDVEGLSGPEVAETLQVKLATVKSRVHRARLFLRTRLAQYVTIPFESRACRGSEGISWAMTWWLAARPGASLPAEREAGSARAKQRKKISARGASRPVMGWEAPCA